MAEEQTVCDLESRVSVYNSTCTSDLQFWDRLGGGAGARALNVPGQGLDLNSSPATFCVPCSSC